MDRPTVPIDRQPDVEGRLDRGRRDDRRPEGARPVVGLGLWEVEGVLPLDRPGRYVVPDRVSDDRERCVENERQLGLGDVPVRVGSDADLGVRADRAPAGCLQEELRPLGLVDAVVGGRLHCLLDAGVAGPEVGDARRPDLLRLDRRDHATRRHRPSIRGRDRRLERRPGPREHAVEAHIRSEEPCGTLLGITRRESEGTVLVADPEQALRHARTIPS
jgi:hypothetical protein